MAAVDFSNLGTQLAAVIEDAKSLLEKVTGAAAAEAQIAKLSSDLATAQEDAAASQAKADDYAAQLKALHDQIGATLNPPAQSAA